MKTGLKISLATLVLLAGVMAFSQVKASAATLCGVLAYAPSGNCENGQDYTALTGLSGNSDQMKNQFINKMDGFLHGQEHQRAGAVWIITRMLGGNPGNDSWKNVIRSSDVTFSKGNYSYSVNTAYDTVNNRVIQYGDRDTRQSLIIRYKGVVYGAIKLDCGNPLDNPTNLPQGWTLDAETKVNKGTAEPGENVTFAHMIHNNGEGRANYGWRIVQSKTPNQANSWSAVANDSVTSAGVDTNHPDWRKIKIKIPANASAGDKICQRIDYSNKFGPGTKQFPNDYAYSGYKCVTVRATPGDDENASCNSVNVTSYGTYNGNATRVKVKVDGVRVKKMDGSPVPQEWNDLPASGSYATVPDDNGDTSQKSRRWYFVPRQAVIHVEVVHEWWYPGGDNPGTPNRTETNYNRGWHKIPGTTEINENRTCASATCQVTSVQGNGPNDIIVAGQPVTITLLITNTSVGQGVVFTNPYAYGNLNGQTRYSNGGEATYRGWSTEVEMTATAPATTGYWAPSISTAGYDIGGVSASCPMNEWVYKYVSIDPNASVGLNPTDENPSKADYRTWVSNNKDMAIFVETAALFYRIPGDGSPVQILKSKALGSESYPPGQKDVLSGSHTAGPWQAGDQFCVLLSINIGGGYIGPWGIVAYPDPAPAPATDCATVHNKPYFKTYGKGIRAGGGFGGAACSQGGLLAGWNDNTAAADRGTGSQLSALARIKITGVASAQASASNEPDKLTFANSGSGVSAKTTGADSPTLGGSFGGTFCFDDVESTASADTVGTPVVGASGSKKYTGNKTIAGNSINKGVNQSIFVNGNVYITAGASEGIKYNGWTSASQIPSFILRATGNIYIDPNVTQLDGLYIAGGKIYTCATGLNAQVPLASLYNSCNKQLKVNGSFIATQVNLMRTYGSLRDSNKSSGNATAPESPNNTRLGAHPNDWLTCSNPGGAVGYGALNLTCAAEYFNFSPEMYLANPAIQLPNSGTRNWDSVVSLPPVL